MDNVLGEKGRRGCLLALRRYATTRASRTLRDSKNVPLRTKVGDVEENQGAEGREVSRRCEPEAELKRLFSGEGKKAGKEGRGLNDVDLEAQQMRKSTKKRRRDLQ